jgi:hypothetical protein
MLCETGGYQGGDYEECRPLGCDTVWLLVEPNFGGTYGLHHQGEQNQRARSNVSNNELVPSSLILLA